MDKTTHHVVGARRLSDGRRGGHHFTLKGEGHYQTPPGHRWQVVSSNRRTSIVPTCPSNRTTLAMQTDSWGSSAGMDVSVGGALKKEEEISREE